MIKIFRSIKKKRIQKQLDKLTIFFVYLRDLNPSIVGVDSKFIFCHTAWIMELNMKKSELINLKLPKNAVFLDNVNMTWKSGIATVKYKGCILIIHTSTK